MPTYSPLWCKSNFSFLEAASHPWELAEQAHALGLDALALTDRDGVHGIVQAWAKAKEIGLRLIVGSEVTVDDGSHIVLLAQDRAGYANLCRLVTAGRMRSPKGESAVSWSEVCGHEKGLIALWGGEHSLFTREEEPAVAGSLRDAFGDRLYAMITRHHLALERRHEQLVRKRAARLGMPILAAQEILYHTPTRRPLHDILTCIRHGTTIHAAGRRIRANAEHALLASSAFQALFADDSKAIERTREVADRCTFALSDLRYRYPSAQLPNGTTSAERLRFLTHQGARNRYPDGIPLKVLEQLKKELELIERLDYPGYFLTMWEIVEFCKSKDILCQGRGSAANSAVCYCLGITAIDPVRMDLLFERFISAERAEAPDIDLDIQHARREEVIQFIYQKYGQAHAAMVANVIRYRPKSAIRDVGKALGLPKTLLDRFAKLVSFWDDGGNFDLLRQVGFDPTQQQHQRLLQLTGELLGFPRHLSIHPGGFLLGHKPVHDLVPVEKARMKGRTVIQWDKNDVEELGLFKVDLLALGALTHIDLTLKLLKKHRGLKLTLSTIPSQDPKTYDMICKGDTVGVFQIESRAQMSMLPRLQPRTFYDLVIEISIVRPGPISGNMVNPYLQRRKNPQLVEYPHPSLEPVLKRTLGVPLFQEQVMKLAVVGAGYTPGEADQLRRDMAAWRHDGKIYQHRERLISGMQQKGIRADFAERVFEQIKGFGEYGFPESHAASFAIIAYATSWLKYNYPEEFTCGLLNAQPMGFYSPATIIEDAKRHGVRMLPVNVLHSRWDCTLENLPGKRFAVRMGLRYVSGLSEEDGRKIVSAFSTAAFTSLDDFMERTALSEKALAVLAKAGAFDGFHLSRRDALWGILGHANTSKPTLLLPLSEETPGFARIQLPELINWDYRHADHSVRGHPMAGLRKALRALGLPDAKSVNHMRDGRKARFAGAVINRQRPQTAKGVTFMTLEDETGWVNLVVWQLVFDRYSVIARTAPILGVTGKLQAKEGIVHLVADELWVPPLRQKPETVSSRDFR